MAQGVFCLEGEWNGKLTDRLSVRNHLELLTPARGAAPLIHRDVATREELCYYLGKWVQKQYANYSVAYLAFHGSNSNIHLGRDNVSLDELADALGTKAAGRTIFFGSCETMAAPDEALADFVAKTRVRGVVGYVKSVDWLASAAFDYLLLPLLLERTYTKTVYTALARDHAGYVRDLGFRMATKGYVSPRKVALAASPANGS